MNALVSRRAVLAGGGALIVSFPLRRAFGQESKGQSAGKKADKLPGSLDKEPMLDGWIRIDPDNTITVFTGKAELGQGIKTALIQVAAEELSVEPQAITLITADTSRTPNEGYTAGSHSMQESGTAILNAAAQVRGILIGVAAERLGQPADQLKTEQGAVVAGDGRRLRYGELVSDQLLHVRAEPQSELKDPKTYAIMGKSMPRVDIPGKVTGGPSYVQDLRLEGMVHARVVRPPSYEARLQDVDTGEVEKMPGVLKIVRDGNYLAVITEREFQAVQAMQALAAAAKWQDKASLPEPTAIYDYLQKAKSEDTVIYDQVNASPAAAQTIEAVFHRPYQMHSSIGPSCAVALFADDKLQVWTHSQGVYPLRKAIAEMLRLPPESVECIHLEGSGCYGHNAADDAGADAALLAHYFPGRPVRVQWMRDQEHGWEPYGPAMVTHARASLSGDGRIVDWQYEVWSNTHSTRPGPAGQLLAARHVAAPFQPPPPRSLPQPDGGGDRNAIPLYKLPARVVKHFIPEMPLRVSALRGLGAYMNIFSVESFMDELAQAAKVDPVEFRLRHLEDERARDVVTKAAEAFGWADDAKLPAWRGRGFAFARYKNSAAYAAIAMEVEIARETGHVQVRRAVAAVDSGQTVNPDGIRNQIEGGIIQSISWTLYETVTFDTARITSTDWSTYPILRFSSVPGSVEVHVIDRPGQPFLGTGEAAQGPAAAALANAIAHATGKRFRDLPLRPDRIKAAVWV
jgi:CO/xanthine dehydrogenase Mo-binding subunit